VNTPASIPIGAAPVPPTAPAAPPDPAVTEQQALTALGALAQASRLRVFRALVGAGPAGLTPGALAATLGMPASTLSFHLKELSHAGLVTPQRAGRHLIYRPEIARMNALLAYLTAHCCHGARCDLATPPAAARC
jgi:ArsR family transcriptional regulator, arsenate/arsenite/antimonite-responsive transcriptional repressor